MFVNMIRIPPARFLDLLERLFSLKRFQRDAGIAGLGKERRNRYRVCGVGIVTKVLRSSLFFSWQISGGKYSMVF